MLRDFKEGDLVYIPQAVHLWDHGANQDNGSFTVIQTEKPITAVCMKPKKPAAFYEDNRWIQIYAKGQAWAVLKENIYPLEETNVS